MKNVFTNAIKIGLLIFITLIFQNIGMSIGTSDFFDYEWYWSYSVPSKPLEYPRVVRDGVVVMERACLLDYTNIALGGPIPVYKYQGSSNCGTAFWSVLGLLSNLIIYGTLFWFLFLRQARKII
jgi:hypothetical protein